jgi:hypothetical protein
MGLSLAYREQSVAGSLGENDQLVQGIQREVANAPRGTRLRLALFESV